MRFLALLVGWVILAFGAIRLTVGLFAASIDDPAERAAAVSRYIGTGTSGEAIDRAIVTLLVGFVFLILARLLKRT